MPKPAHPDASQYFPDKYLHHNKHSQKMMSQTGGVYADHPFPLLNTPSSQLPDGIEASMFHHMATDMVMIHNVIFRGLNSVYLQAEHITPTDEDSFINYMSQWLRLLHIHHEGEETLLFPAIERLSGEQGIMEVNVEQHHLFGVGLAEFEKYVNACLAREERYSGKRVIELIDVFGSILATHLTEEIATLLALERFGDKLKGLPAVFEEQAKHGMTEAGMLTGLPFFSANFDRHFENDRWITIFPPGPGQAALKIVRNVTYWLHRDWWKYGACDRMGKMRPLYAAKPDGKRTVVITTVQNHTKMPETVVVKTALTPPQAI